MSDTRLWQESNDAYLATALAWLRLRLDRLRIVSEPVGEMSATPPQPEVGSRWRPFRKTSLRLPTVPLLPAYTASREEELSAAAAAMAAAESVTPPPALVILADRLGLSHFERDVLLLCAAIEMDTRVPALCAEAQGDPGRPYCTFALALLLFDDPAWDVLSPERPLRHWRLVEINQPPGQPLTMSSVRADERIVNYIKGLNYLDDRLAPLMSLVQGIAESDHLPPSQTAVADAAIAGITGPLIGESVPLIELLGNDTSSKHAVASMAAKRLGLQLLHLPAQALPSGSAEVESLARLWRRESILLPIALYIDAREGGADRPELTQSLNLFLSRIDGVAFLDSADRWSASFRRALTLDVDKPTPAEQRAAWRFALGPDGEGDANLLAGHFNIDVAAIFSISSEARRQRAGGASTVGALAWQACLASTRPKLDVLAQRLDVKSRWDDIVLPPTEAILLRQIADQVGQRTTVYEDWGYRQRMNRGLGIAALFAGESGTGKTMAAEVIANELHLNLYRIDLSGVVDKYIGETEKKLRRLFDAAEDGGAILFFDEADALFGKRSEVKDSHDRYANIEIGYLLQRMEAFRGLAILATNMKSSIDSAFLRRLRFVVTFRVPGPDERRIIWEKSFPRETPKDGLDFARLARLNLTGGSIHNVSVNAAFLAARAGTPVTMPLVLTAARNEMRKLDRHINESDFEWQVTTGAVA